MFKHFLVASVILTLALNAVALAAGEPPIPTKDALYNYPTWAEYRETANFDQLTWEYRCLARACYPVLIVKIFALNHPLWALLIAVLTGAGGKKAASGGGN